MPRLTPAHWKVLECIFTLSGFIFERQNGDHRIYVKADSPRPVVIPIYKEVDIEIIRSNMRTAEMDRETYFELLKKCKKSA